MDQRAKDLVEFGSKLFAKRSGFVSMCQEIAEQFYPERADFLETIEWGDSYAERLLTSPMGSRPVEYGFATRADIEAMAAAFRAWARHPDAIWAFIHMAALARKLH